MAFLTHCPRCGKIQVRPGNFARQAISCSHCQCVFTAHSEKDPEDDSDLIHEPDHIEVLESLADEEVDDSLCELFIDLPADENAEAPLPLMTELLSAPPPPEMEPEFDYFVPDSLELSPAQADPTIDDVEVVTAERSPVMSPLITTEHGEVIVEPIAAPTEGQLAALDEVEVVDVVARDWPAPPPRGRLDAPLDIRKPTPRGAAGLSWGMWLGLGLGFFGLVVVAVVIAVVLRSAVSMP